MKITIKYPEKISMGPNLVLDPSTDTNACGDFLKNRSTLNFSLLLLRYWSRCYATVVHIV